MVTDRFQSRTYRDRKTQYTKSLETEVARLQAREASLLCEAEQYRNTIDTLQTLLGNCGIHAGVPGVPVSAPKETYLPTPSPGLQSDHATERGFSESWYDDYAAISSHCASPVDGHVLETSAAPHCRNSPSHEHDATVMGMEFVLA